MAFTDEIRDAHPGPFPLIRAMSFRVNPD